MAKSKITVCPPQPTPKHTHQMKGKSARPYRKSTPPNKMGGDPVLTATTHQGSSRRSKEEATELLSKALRAI